MEARFFRCWSRLAVLPVLLIAMGARYETENFIVQNAQTTEQARAFCETAEQCRYELAVLWLGRPMPNWSAKCPIQVKVGANLGAGGATTFIFHGGEVYGWEMDIQGSEQRILDSVLPHEITHMIFASHFRRPVPRWLDEGAATSVEHDSEKNNYRRMLREFIRADVHRCLPFNRMVAHKEYPSDVMPFYAQGFSVVEYLIAVGGQRRLLRFAESGIKTDDWNKALRDHYGFENLGQLQEEYWLKWVAAGSPQQLPSELRPAFAPPSGSIAQVSATPSPAYGSSAVTRIPVTMNDGSRVVPIPSSYETPPNAVLPSAAADSLDHWVGIEQSVSKPTGTLWR